MADGSRRRVVILGAGGRDFHNFNTVYRDDPGVEVLAFGAAQIPGIADRRYPPSLAGPLYPDGIPILDQAGLPAFCREQGVEEVVFAYSDVSHEEVMHTASAFLAVGCDFAMLGPGATMLRSARPVIAVTAVRTGCGKSPVSRHITGLLASRGVAVGVLRHPMPYGDLARQEVQRFATVGDLDAAQCTVEEREEYQPYVTAGQVVFAGVDYQRILAAAEAECDVILWDGGNNDFPFLRPDLLIVLADALRPGHETAYHPGETLLRMADHVLIMKVADAAEDDVRAIESTAAAANPGAGVIHGDLEVSLDRPDAVEGKRVLVIEDGPTITHGGRPTGAGYAGARAAGAEEIVDPRPHAVSEIAETYAHFPHIGPVLPALGYYPEQLAALAETIARVPADVVVAATPANLENLLEIDKPLVRASYAYVERDTPGLAGIVTAFCDRLDEGRGGTR
ncbi:MAG: cyclic 2,3-diphosphoglycerate synthase [Alphaproteobacteria bacterium]|nr:cyclic 2,3-diphosphoglycerate synthase [Alphaproteobacteria bacterium]